MLGRVFDRLRDLHLEESTIVVFTTDHGEMMGDHGMLFKSVMYEEATRVPTMLRLPGAAPPALRVAAPVSHIDLVPTLLELLEQPLPRHLQGRSWAPYLRERRPPPEGDVVVVWDGPDDLGNHEHLPAYLSPRQQEELRRRLGTPLRMIVTPEGWKLTVDVEGNGELYNLRQDPAERVNLFGRPEHRAAVRGLVDRIRLWQRATGDRAPIAGVK
jgi:arylsulfatase A-like enzyme